MKIIRLTLAALVITLASGCAVGNKYSYHDVDIGLPVKGSGDVGLAVVEDRAAVLNGEKESNFVGLQRGGFGNPFDVTTASGNSLIDDFAKTLESALTKSGFNVTVLQNISNEDTNAAVANVGGDKNVVLKVTEWKTDIYMNLNLAYDLTLSVVSGDGSVLASTESKGDEKLSGAAISASGNSEIARGGMETKIARMFNDPEIRAALE